MSKLIRICESALDLSINENMVRDHGYLWLTIPDHPDNSRFYLYARSLATGYVFYWYYGDDKGEPCEFEEADGE